MSYNARFHDEVFFEKEVFVDESICKHLTFFPIKTGSNSTSDYVPIIKGKIFLSFN